MITCKLYSPSRALRRSSSIVVTRVTATTMLTTNVMRLLPLTRTALAVNML